MQTGSETAFLKSVTLFMSRIVFDETYIAVFPSYEETELHKHSMLHVFIGKDTLALGNIARGRLIILEQNIEHSRPCGDLSFFLFVDPTSTFADNLRRNYLKGQPVYASDDEIIISDLSKEGLRGFVAEHFGDDCFVRRQGIDQRIRVLLDDIDSFSYLDSRVTEIADKLNYSESYLTHLFKAETGVSLKGYLLLRRFEYVWTQISTGGKMTDAILDAGFSSPSHFSDTCKKLTGISASDVLR